MVDLASAKELLPLGSEDIKIYLIGVFGVKVMDSYMVVVAGGEDDGCWQWHWQWQEGDG
ncbi:hypothetical protein HanIR_Chr16g0813791 [Helianthus annuus]|nr:hypothetical protein HanIR_Chr16g0813791 [Helianthus annuus]